MNNIEKILRDFDKYIVTPVQNFGLGGFVFDYEIEAKADLSAEITDHFLEDNTAVQDHIAIKPKKITLKSYVGELISADLNAKNEIFKAQRKLTRLNGVLPVLSSSAQQARESIDQGIDIEDIQNNISSVSANDIEDFWRFVENLPYTNFRQQKVYQYLQSLMRKKIAVSVQTPFEFMENMAIERITAVQGEDTQTITDFSVTLKELRFANSLTVPEGEVSFETQEDVGEKFQGRAGLQNSTLDNIGNISGITPDNRSQEIINSANWT